MGLVIWFEIDMKLVINGLDMVWKLVGILSDTSLNKRSWNN